LVEGGGGGEGGRPPLPPLLASPRGFPVGRQLALQVDGRQRRFLSLHFLLYLPCLRNPSCVATADALPSLQRPTPHFHRNGRPPPPLSGARQSSGLRTLHSATSQGSRPRARRRAPAPGPAVSTCLILDQPPRRVSPHPPSPPLSLSLSPSLFFFSLSLSLPLSLSLLLLPLPLSPSLSLCLPRSQSLRRVSPRDWTLRGMTLVLHLHIEHRVSIQ